jgi:membrane-bound acyltransferase YfiQ involved in biofilm formation
MRNVVVYIIRGFFIVVLFLLILGFVTLYSHSTNRFESKGIYDILAVIIVAYLTYLSFNLKFKEKGV